MITNNDMLRFLSDTGALEYRDRALKSKDVTRASGGGISRNIPHVAGVCVWQRQKLDEGGEWFLMNYNVAKVWADITVSLACPEIVSERSRRDSNAYVFGTAYCGRGGRRWLVLTRMVWLKSKRGYFYVLSEDKDAHFSGLEGRIQSTQPTFSKFWSTPCLRSNKIENAKTTWSDRRLPNDGSIEESRRGPCQKDICLCIVFKGKASAGGRFFREGHRFLLRRQKENSQLAALVVTWHSPYSTSCIKWMTLCAKRMTTGSCKGQLLTVPEANV